MFGVCGLREPFTAEGLCVLRANARAEKRFRDRFALNAPVRG